jgi:hypothetical protein
MQRSAAKIRTGLRAQIIKSAKIISVMTARIFLAMSELQKATFFVREQQLAQWMQIEIIAVKAHNRHAKTNVAQYTESIFCTAGWFSEQIPDVLARLMLVLLGVATLNTLEEETTGLLLTSHIAPFVLTSATKSQPEHHFVFVQMHKVTMVQH